MILVAATKATGERAVIGEFEIESDAIKFASDSYDLIRKLTTAELAKSVIRVQVEIENKIVYKCGSI